MALHFENCSICGKGFTTKSGHKRHFQAHNNDDDDEKEEEPDGLYDDTVR